MVAVVKKCLCLVALLFLVTRLVDFSAPEFDPLRSQWQTPLGHIAQHQHQLYGDYVRPVQQKVAPLVACLQDEYVAPAVAKVGGVCLAQYRAHLHKYAGVLHDKVTQSPAHAVWEEHKPTLEQACRRLCGYLDLARRAATSYTAAGLIKTDLALRYAVAQIDVFTRDLISRLALFYAELKPQVCAFYRDTAVPASREFVEKTQSCSLRAWANVKQYSLIAYAQTQSFYYAKVYPLLDVHVFSHIKVYYNLYAKQHVDAVYTHASKYYALLKVDQALGLSKDMISGTYDQAAQYFNQEKIEVESTVIEATTAEEEDLPTGTVYDSMDTPEVPITDDDASETEIGIETETESTQDSRQTVDVVQQSVVTENDLEKRTEDEVVLSLAQEIQTWKKYIFESVDNIFASFDSCIADMENVMISDFRPELTKMLQNLSETAYADFAVINKAIYNINSTTVVLENGQEVEVDEADNVIDHKVTREEMRTLLAENSDKLRVFAEEINTKLKSFVSDVEVAIDEEKKLIVEIYEEFAEVAINEFSKKMMYSTFSSSFDNFQNKKDDESFKDWREYVKVKNSLISRREDLIQKKPHLSGINTLLVEVRETLRALDHETGSYYAILRAQANLAFQAREKEERLAAEAEGDVEVDADEEPLTVTIKSTVIQTQTLNEDGTINTDVAEIPVIEDEELSDVESGDEDFDTPEESSEPVAVVDIPEAHTVVFTPPEESVEVEQTATVAVDVPEASTVTFTPPEQSDAPIYVVDTPEGVTVEFTPVDEPAAPTPEAAAQDILEHVDEPEIKDEDEPLEEEQDLEDVLEHNEDDDDDDDEYNHEP